MSVLVLISGLFIWHLQVIVVLEEVPFFIWIVMLLCNVFLIRYKLLHWSSVHKHFHLGKNGIWNLHIEFLSHIPDREILFQYGKNTEAIVSNYVNTFVHKLLYILYIDKLLLPGPQKRKLMNKYLVLTSVICGSPKRNEIITTIKTNISWHIRCFLISLGNPSWMEVTTTSTMAN